MLFNSIIKKLFVLTLSFLLIGCNGFFEKDNVPTPKSLVEFKQTLAPKLLWSFHTQTHNNEKYLKLNPGITHTAIITASSTGVITSINKQQGKQNWQIHSHMDIVAGVGVGSGMVLIGGRHGEVLAINEMNGGLRWKKTVPGEILASPLIHNNIVIIKTTNGYLLALSAETGKQLWSFKQTEPNLILRSASQPLIQDGYVIVGFANGNLVKLNIDNGQLVWQQAITQPEGAFAIQRMIDIDADPIIFKHHIYVATYQGKLASLGWIVGEVLWSHDISTYTGMVANDDSIYLSDAKSHVWSFNAKNGFVNWRQTEFEWRTITAPALMNNYVIVGDEQGYIHWLNPQDGHLMARIFAGASIYATPIVNNNILYVMTSNGYLLAYSLR